MCVRTQRPAGTASGRWEQVFCYLWWLELQGLAILSGLRKLFPQPCTWERFYIESLLYAGTKSQPDTHKSKPTHAFEKKKKKSLHDSLHKQAWWTPLGGGAAVRRSCSIMKHICTLITKAKVVRLAGSTNTALGYDLGFKYRHRNIKKLTHWVRESSLELPGQVGQQPALTIKHMNCLLHWQPSPPARWLKWVVSSDWEQHLQITGNCPAACLYYKVGFPAFHPAPSVISSVSLLSLGRARR